MEMHPMQMSMASWLTILLMLTFLAIASPDPDSRQPLHRRGKMLYEALGDSYAAGTGAGKIINKDSHCQQFTDSYPMLLNTLLDDGETMPAETHHACPGATVEDIIKYQRTNLSANLVTVTVGLEIINFAEVIGECVFRFQGRKSAGCETTLVLSSAKLEDELPRKARKIIEDVLEGDKEEGFHLYLTGFARFWNTKTPQCGSVSWNYWQDEKPPYGAEFGRPHSGGELMTIPRREFMNNWIIKVNDILASVVDTVRKEGEKRVSFVNYDMGFEGHRFCEQGVTEPQVGDEPRAETYFFQYNTPKDQLWGPDDMTPALGAPGAWMKWIAATFEDKPTVQVNEYYAGHSVSLDVSATVPISFAKMFHPTPAGHWAIALAIQDAIEVANDPEAQIEPPTLNRPSHLLDQLFSCREEALSLNWPKFWVLEDGKLSTAQVLQRIRNQACRGVCDAVPGIPGNLVEYKRQGDNGCEYAVKIASDFELYMHASQAGDNCEEAMTLIIDQCMTEAYSTPLKAGATITGPNPGEFFDIGVRPMNAPESKHDPFRLTKDNLEHRQISCSVLKYRPVVRIGLQVSYWNDHEGGASIRRAVYPKCKLVVSRLRNYPTDFHFSDGQAAHRLITFDIPMEVPTCIEDALEVFFGLTEGSIYCLHQFWRDVRYIVDGSQR